MWIQIGIPVFAISILLLALLRGYRIQKYGVDIPYVDEWSQLFDPFTGTVGWNGKLNLAWLWFPWGDHRIVTTKLLIWLLLQYNDWNLITGLWVSYLTYLVIPILLCVMARLNSKRFLWALLPFLIFFFSNANADNDLWGFQIQWRFYNLFLLIAVLLLFDERQRIVIILLGAIGLVLCMISIAGGVAASLALVLVYAGYKLFRMRTGSSARQELLGLALVSLMVLLVAATWLTGWSGDYGKWRYPIDRVFWIHYLGQISTMVGFLTTIAGHQPVSVWAGGAVLMGLMAALGADWWTHRAQPSVGLWRRIGLEAAVLACLGSISLGRSVWGLKEAGLSQHFEAVQLLLPVFVLSGYSALAQNRLLRRGFLVLLFAVCSYGFSHRWDDSLYRIHWETTSEGVTCLQNHLKLKQPLVCNSLHSIPLDSYVKAAKTLNLSFYQRYLANVK